MEVNKHEILEQKMCKELETLEDKYRSGEQLSMQDLEKIDKLYHALKSMATYNAMKEAEDYSEEGWSSEGGNSGRRGRAANGRFVSRDMDRSNSYADGYSEGYSEAMNQMNGNSGHYPMYYPTRRY